MTAPIQSVPRNLPAPATPAAVVLRLLLVAASQIGYREGRAPSGSWTNDNAFGKWYGTNGVSWCAQFVSWAAAVAGLPQTVVPKHQYTPSGWNWFRAHDCDVTTPQVGDIFYVYGYVAAEGQSRVHHVGIVEKVLSGGRIQTIEGNTNTSGSSQGNGVYRLVRPVTDKLRFARPPYALAVVKSPPPGSTPTPPKEKIVTPEQMQELKDAADASARRWAVWGALYEVQSEDEKIRARDAYAAAKAAGKTDQQAADAAWAVMRPLAEALQNTQKKG